MAKQEEAAVTKRSFMKNLRIEFGVMNMNVALFNPLRANVGKEERLNLACPTHALSGEAVKVAQQYACSVDRAHGPFTPADCEKAKEIDGELVLVDKDAVAAAKEDSSLPDGLLRLTSHPADEVLPYLVHTGKTYVVSPQTESDSFYTVLLRIIGPDGFIKTDSGPKILMGEMLVKKVEKIMRITKWNGQLVIEEMARPEDVDEFTPPKESDDDNLDNLSVLTKQWVSVNAEPFVADNYRNQVRERIAEVVADAQGTVVTAKPKAVAKGSSQDLVAMLEAAISAKAKEAK